MFFEKKERVTIDGHPYDISNPAQVDMWNSKGALNEIYLKLDAGSMDMDRTFENFAAWKKDFIKVLKEWDKLYVKHAKSIYPEMNAIH